MRSRDRYTGDVSKITEAVKTACVHLSLRPTGLKAGVNESAPPLCIARAQPLQGEARDFARILQVKFVFDVRPMGFHCLGAEMQ